MSKKKKNTNPYERLGIISIEDVQKATGETLEFEGETLRLSSLRVQTFLIKGTTCSHCGLKATHFAVERHKRKQEGHSDRYHLNLYGKDDIGNEVLFTHDHTQARALGGAHNSLRNTTTMCFTCNSIKGQIENLLLKFDERRKMVEKGC